MLSLSLALVCNALPSSEQQPRALGIWAAVSAVALTVGPLAGGLLVELDWRVIFWMKLPVAALGVAITVIAAPEPTDPAPALGSTGPAWRDSASGSPPSSWRWSSRERGAPRQSSRWC